MGRIEKTVFISYRRTNVPWALAIYQNLTMHGYDVFFDFQSIDSGNFEKVILGNIKARAHFLVILTPSALEHCKEPGDWLRREIETAMDEKRNIVPLMLESFDFGSPLVTEALTGRLATLKSYNGLRVYSEYFFEAMDKLRERYLNVAVSDIALPAITNAKTQAITKSLKSAASEARQVEKEELTAQEWFERGYTFQKANNFNEAIRCYSEAISLEPNDSIAYSLRGSAHYNNGDLDKAFTDHSKSINLAPELPEAYYLFAQTYKKQNDFDNAIKVLDEAIRIKPDYIDAYWLRGECRKKKDDINGAITDFTEAIRLKSDNIEARSSRGFAHIDKGNIEEAIIDFSEIIRITPSDPDIYYIRGVLYGFKGNFDNEIADYTKVIQLKPDYAKAYFGRADLWQQKKEYDKAITDYQKYIDLGGGISYGNEKKVKGLIRVLKKKLK